MRLSVEKGTKENQASEGFLSTGNSFDINRLIAIDTIRVDDHVRLTLTRKVRHVFPISAGDTLVVYQDKYNSDELLFKIQRDKDIVDNWVVKRKYVGGMNKNKVDSMLATSMLEINTDKTPGDLYDANNSVYTGTRNRLARILLIDDEEDVLYSFKSVLSSQGYDVKPFRESKEALKYLFGLKNAFSMYDLAIIDIRMPDINGIQFYQILKVMNTNIKVYFLYLH